MDQDTEQTATSSDVGHQHEQVCYALDCPHEHDDTCGYSEAAEGAPCGYVCEICAGEPDKDSGTTENTGENGLPTPEVPEVPELEPVQPEGAAAVTVTSFDELDETVKHQTVEPGTTPDELNLPATLGASGYIVADDSEPVPDTITINGVTWEPNSPWDETAEQGSYVFTPVLPDGYELANDTVALPEISVRVEAAPPNTLTAGEYDTDDVAVIQAIYDNNNLTEGKKDDISSWSFATWSTDSPKRITELNFFNKDLEGTLNVSGLSSLTDLSCSDNQLTALNVSGLSNLTSLSCSDNQLTELDVSSLSSLTDLDCSANQLKELDVSGLSNPRTLYCHDNPFTSFQIKDGHTLTVTPTMGGTVWLTSFDIDSNEVRLTAKPDTGYVFTAWESLPDGVSSSSDSVTFTLSGNMNVEALFQATLTDGMIAPISDQTYTGQAIKPEPVVSAVIDGNPIEFEKDKDFTYSYPDGGNINVGTANITITPTADGRLTGTPVTKQFLIVKSDSQLTGLKTYSGSTQTILPMAIRLRSSSRRKWRRAGRAPLLPRQSIRRCFFTAIPN